MGEFSGVDINAILSRIASEVRQRAVAASPTSAPLLSSAGQRGEFSSAFRPKEATNNITLQHLLTFRDEEFIRSAYQGVLDREPDPIGLAGYLEHLRSGSLSKLDVLVALRFSEEGRCVGASINGLTRAYWARRIKNIPFVGYILQIIYAVCALPVVLKHLTAQAAYVDAQFSFVHDRAKELDGKLLGNAQDLSQSKLQSETDRQEVLALRAVSNAARAVVVELQHHLARLEFAKANRRELSGLSERVDLGLSSKADRQEVAALAEQMGTKAGLAEVQSKADYQDVAVLSTATGEAKNLVAELQHHLAELELAKVDRQEVAALAEQMGTKAGLAEMQSKADHQELAALSTATGEIRNLVAELQHHLAELELAQADQQEIATLTEQMGMKADQQGHHLTSIEARVAQCENRSVDPHYVALLGDDLHLLTNQVDACRQDLRDQHRRLGVFLELARKRMPEAFTSEQVTRLLSEESHFLDSLYVAFEERFRGSREAVRQGTKVYLPYLQKVLGKADTVCPVLDVACGRGEWLELLQTHGYPAKGIDVNRIALQNCRELGLDVIESDALEYLRKIPANALSAVTCFHYIEHIDYTSLVTLLDEVLRVLKPGGLAIFETPNARNILVSSGDFYRDPTHRNPVFPETLESIAELRGFAESTAYCFDDARTELIPFSAYRFEELNDYVKISRDLAWIGVKSS